jgi:ribonucleotide reductase alpha subunit
LGARLGAISVTLDMWHLDIYDFFDLQTETGDIRSKAFDIFPGRLNSRSFHEVACAKVKSLDPL